MALQSFLFLLGTATLALVASNAQTTTSDNSPPLPEASAKAVFEHGDRHIHPQVAPNIFTVGNSGPPRPSGIVRPTVRNVKLPQVATPIVNKPGVPDTGSISVGVNQSIPLAKFSNESLASNSSLHGNSTLAKRQTCGYPNCCPDPRFLSESTAFPYGVMGKWQNPYESCSGTLVGPRHVLTASHCIDWNGANSWTGSISFSPQYWPGHDIGTYTSSLLIRYDQTPESGLQNDFNIAFDFVVAVLDDYPNLGWIGSKTYDTAWNDQAFWYQSGYAANAGGTQYPYAQGPFEVVAEIPEGLGSDILGKS